MTASFKMDEILEFDLFLSKDKDYNYPRTKYEAINITGPEGRPIIGHDVSLFPISHSFFFILIILVEFSKPRMARISIRV